jgi:ABC-type transport system substrate-binding protein
VGGFNAVSYNNPRVTEILDTAIDLPGCDQAARAELYHEAYEILRDEVPWLWVGGATTLSVAQPYVQNWQPRDTASLQGLWNVENWIVQP